MNPAWPKIKSLKSARIAVLVGVVLLAVMNITIMALTLTGWILDDNYLELVAVFVLTFFLFFNSIAAAALLLAYYAVTLGKELSASNPYAAIYIVPILLVCITSLRGAFEYRRQVKVSAKSPS